MMQLNIILQISIFITLQIGIFPLYLHAETSAATDYKKDLATILSPFVHLNTIHFVYTEKRSSAFFKSVQISTGEIKFIKPDRIIKQQLTPISKTYDINKWQLVVIEKVIENAIEKERENIIEKTTEKVNKNSQINIDNYPKLKQFVALLKALLSGNTTFIHKHYDGSIVYVNNNPKQLANDWQLKLVPKYVWDELEQNSVRSINVLGNNKQIKNIKVLGFGNESSEMSIEKILSQSR